MDENLTRVLIAIVGVVAALISSFATHRLTADKAAEKIEQLSREASAAQARLDVAESRLAEVEPELERSRTELETVRAKWERCSTPGDVVAASPSTSDRWTAASVKTGDRLRFKLDWSSVFVDVLRVTQDGPILKVRGCDYPGILEGLTSPVDGEHAYLLPDGASLTLSVSSECCERSIALCSLESMEQIDIKIQAYDAETQTSDITYRKTLI